ncbi:MAG: signal recognition particle-docking protein FtsY [Rickettsiales bacterium]|jgi:fused signal recognition particle receptor|nr:signal recognition particle-docking protein FtsY [Rickettsiales bacterium]
MFAKLKQFFRRGKIDADALFEILVEADTAPDLALELTEPLRKLGHIDEAERVLRGNIAGLLTPCEAELDLSRKPSAILLFGVNGAGKTTTCGKLAHLFAGQGKRVLIAACDTFRASGAEQLGEWADRAGARFFSRPGGDPAAAAFDGMKQAIAEGDDIALFDTAGRLGNNQSLMAELEKTVRSVEKAGGRPVNILVLDGNGGQNSIAQYENFGANIRIDGIVATKTDGSAKGGFLLSLARRHKAKIFFSTHGEGIGDISPFRAQNFVARMFKQ